MKPHLPYQTLGFRFLDTMDDSELYQLFAIGYDKVTSHAYNWDGMKRIDGPLYLFQYTVSGYGTVILDGQTYRVDPGYAFLVDIPSCHRYFLPKSSESWEFYFILFRPAKLENHWQELIQRLTRVPYIPPDSSVIRSLHDTFYAGINNRITDGYLASSIVYRFMMELLRFSTGRTKEKESWPTAVRQAAQELEKRYRQIQSLDEIAAGAGLSKYHFVRVFRKFTGFTPIEYLTKIRVERSIELLRSTDLNIDEVAKEVGYAGGSYFIKVFRQWVGFSPGEFRSGRELVGLQRMKFD
ncbi:helix-turn-helix domain-containing protein [Paenibacillus sedimenti]|uniref:Helix-turn-helix transcriptional regulator n=1 Tax=Paenibacillus sedimenti TaxID=2770274 RepID=A0A926KMP7_9BACL|nr:AraC family transcriptional regulator [Paenibacillus sedimenti]MBD0378860.1 helix-turn-helix transcriptional regulator [Paenibacillus sedimenti]